MFARFFKCSEEAAVQTTPSEATAPEVPTPRPALQPDQALVDALSESRRRFKDIVEVSGDFAWETDSDGVFVYVSPGMSLGYPPDEMVGVPASRFIADGAADGAATPFKAREAARDTDIWLNARDGRTVCLTTSAVPIVGDDGDWSGARGICRDVTEERRQNSAFAALQRREVSMARIVQAASRETDPEDMLASALEETRLNFAADYADIRRPGENRDFIVEVAAGDAADAPVLKTVFNRMIESRSLVTAADGDRYHICAPIVYRGNVTGTLLVSRTLNDGAFAEDERRFCEELAAQFALLLAQSDAHRRLEQMARTDEMTGRLNRRAFLADLADRTARAAGGGSGGALFYVDLDNFKAVNDVHGHQRGDEALIALSDLLVLKSRPGDLVARLGGDEFAMWLDRTDEKAAVKRAKDLLDASQGLRIFSGSPDKLLGISVGVAVFEGGSDEQVGELTARADSAMYEIKHGGKSGYVVADAYRKDDRPDDPLAGEARALA